jgi:nucleotide-binding universal stress UspA family protein
VKRDRSAGIGGSAFYLMGELTMHRFRHILYASTGIGDEVEGLKQAFRLARNNQANLTYLLFFPALPESHAPYHEKYRQFMEEQVHAALARARATLQIAESEVEVHLELISGDDPPAISIIRYQLRNNHDLLIKEAEPRSEGTRGFASLDMTLLRKCPCPVWLARPINRPREEIRVAVAVNPGNRETAEHDLSINLLQLARSLADTCNGTLDILSCWDFEFERYLRGNTRVDIPEGAMRNSIQNAQAGHQHELSLIIQASGIGGSFEVHRLRGQADKVIPVYVRSQKIDILVMGTVARTGILGYFMGNTAENIMHELECALLALKPAGFVSPIKA